MELRDYLSPGEYILALMKNVNIDKGKFRNIAVTNRRVILFNTKKTGLLKKAEKVSDMKSFSFEGAHRIKLHIREKGFFDEIERIYVHIGSGIFQISPRIGRTSPEDVLAALIRVFEDFGLQREDEYKDMGDGESIEDIIFTFPENKSRK